MDLVVDANILFVALIKESVTSDLFYKNIFHLFAPEFIFEEFDKYQELLKEKTERTNEEFERLLQILQRRINLIPREEIDPFIEKAREISPDSKDITYVALALRLNCAIWSNDKALKEKQNIVPVYPTHELLKF